MEKYEDSIRIEEPSPLQEDKAYRRTVVIVIGCCRFMDAVVEWFQIEL